MGLAEVLDRVHKKRKKRKSALLRHIKDLMERLPEEEREEWYIKLMKGETTVEALEREVERRKQQERANKKKKKKRRKAKLNKQDQDDSFQEEYWDELLEMDGGDYGEEEKNQED